MTKFRDLTATELDAIKAFASGEGRRWKSTLNETYWYNARVWFARGSFDATHGTALHGLRNSHGPAWLAAFKLPA